MHIAILGRLPAISMAELEQLYGSKATRWFSDTTALIDAPAFDFERLGGTQKAGLVTLQPSGNWHQISSAVVRAYTEKWRTSSGKITLGISTYGCGTTGRDVQKVGLMLKSALRAHGVNLRLIPNAEAALNTAASHHNKLGLSANHVELLIVRGASDKVVVAESVGAQNITALAARDQARPRTDAFVGMLPPKLARIMVNLTGRPGGILLDPFCGTGVILQEAALLGFTPYGTDLAPKMIDYSRENLEWLSRRYRLTTQPRIEQGDAMTHTWTPPLHCVAAEAYLGQPFSAPPSPEKLREVVGNCNHIISSFLVNLAGQIPSGTPLCLAIPAWRNKEGRMTHLPLITRLDQLGYKITEFQHVRPEQLVYYRDNQVVARELLVIERTMMAPSL